MIWLKKLLLRWVREASDLPKMQYAETLAVNPTAVRRATTISLSNAVNGKVLTLQFYRAAKSAHHDDEIVTSTYVLKDSDSLVEAVAALLVDQKLAEK